MLKQALLNYKKPRIEIRGFFRVSGFSWLVSFLLSV